MCADVGGEPWGERTVSCSICGVTNGGPMQFGNWGFLLSIMDHVGRVLVSRATLAPHGQQFLDPECPVESCAGVGLPADGLVEK